MQMGCVPFCRTKGVINIKRRGKKIFITGLALIFVVIIINTIKSNSERNAGIGRARDDISPVIELDSDKVIIAKGNKFSIKARATDNVDGDLTDNIIVEGNLDTTVVGNYTIKYIVSDSSGNKVEKNQEIEVRNILEGGLPVLMYHFFYEKDDPNYIGKTPDNNILLIDDFIEQMQYLKEDNFYFPTWEEVEEYIDGKQNLPEKSVVITDDDGNTSFFILAVPVIEELGIPVTSFIITNLYEARLQEKYEFINYQSHSDDMHQAGSNGKGAMVNWKYDEIVSDLKESKNKIEKYTNRNCNVFCYPFGHYNEVAKKALKDTGFNFAFTVESGRVKIGADKYALPRVRINRTTTLNEFKKAVN